MGQSISLCMIVKNEEDSLYKCLTSVKGLVDEYIIVDTGSTDRTKEIASAFTDKIYTYHWDNNFSAARNYSIQHATGNWILVLDADEYVESKNFHELKIFLNEINYEGAVGIALPILNFVGSDGSAKIAESSAIRLFTRHKDFIYTRPIHEQLISLRGYFQKYQYQFPIYHTGYMDHVRISKNKSKRNLEIFSGMNTLSPYDSYTMANEFFALDEYDSALSLYQKAFVPSQYEKSWMGICLANMCICLIKLEHFHQAYVKIQWAQRKWAQAGDFYWFEGFLLDHLGFDQHAILSLQKSLNKPSIISPNYVTTHPLQLLSALYIRNFDINNAVRSLTTLCYANPSHFSALSELLRLLSLNDDPNSIFSLLNSIYGEMFRKHAVMLFHSSANLGLEELGDMLLAAVPEIYSALLVPVRMAHALLKNDWEAFKCGLEQLSPPYSAEEKSMFLAGNENWPGFDSHFAKFAAELQNAEVATIFSSCKVLFHQKRYEAYDRIINNPAYRSNILIQMLGDHFFREQQFDLAFDYYSSLLNTQELHAKGYENIAQLYYVQQEKEEACNFLKKGIAVFPQEFRLYVKYYLVSQYYNDEECVFAKKTLAASFPAIIPILSLLK